MNIVIVDNSVAMTGAFKCALNEAELLSARHRFIFVINTQSTLKPLLEEKGFTVYVLPMLEIRKSVSVLVRYPFALLFNSIKLFKILKAEKADVLQINDFYNLLGAGVVRLGFKGKLLTYVRFLPHVIPAPLRKLWIARAIKKSYKVIAVSDAVLNELPDSENVIRLYDPVKLSEALPKKEYNSNSTIQLLYLGNYIQGKGQEYAIKAFAKVYQTHKNIRLKFVGGDMGLEKNKAFRKKLEEDALESGITDAVTFAPFNMNIEAEIKAADIVLNFSEAESFSMTCLEAAFYGTAIIATKCGGPEEIIADKQTGILVNVKDTDAMAESIGILVEDEELRNKYAYAGKNYVRNKFDVKSFEDSFEKLITA